METWDFADYDARSSALFLFLLLICGSIYRAGGSVTRWPFHGTSHGFPWHPMECPMGSQDEVHHVGYPMASHGIIDIPRENLCKSPWDMIQAIPC